MLDNFGKTSTSIKVDDVIQFDLRRGHVAILREDRNLLFGSLEGGGLETYDVNIHDEAIAIHVARLIAIVHDLSLKSWQATRNGDLYCFQFAPR